MLRARLNSFALSWKFNPDIVVDLSGKRDSFFSSLIENDYFIIIEFDLNKRLESMSLKSFAGTGLFDILRLLRAFLFFFFYFNKCFASVSTFEVSMRKYLQSMT